MDEKVRDPPRTAPWRVAVDETTIQIDVRVSRWLPAFVFYYNDQRPNQVLDNLTPVGEVKKDWLDSTVLQ